MLFNTEEFAEWIKDNKSDSNLLSKKKEIYLRLRLDRGNQACCETAYLLQSWCYRHQWQAAPLQRWMHNSGSCCTVLGSCLYKEWTAAGITRRPGFSWRASVLVGQLTRVNKSQDLLFRLTLKPPGRTGNGWNTRPWQLHIGKSAFKSAASFKGREVSFTIKEWIKQQ